MCISRKTLILIYQFSTFEVVFTVFNSLFKPFDLKHELKTDSNVCIIRLKLIFFRCHLKMLISSYYHFQINSAKRIRVTEGVRNF